MSWIHHDKEPVKVPRKTAKGAIFRRIVDDELLIAWLGMGLTVNEIAANFKLTDKGIQYRWARVKNDFGFRCYQDATRYALVHQLIPFKV